MGLWLVLLSLVLACGRLQGTEGIEQNVLCSERCEPGYYNVENRRCKNSSTQYECKKCGSGTYTEVSNLVTECQRCITCRLNEIQIEPCTAVRDTRCDCKKGFFRAYNCKECTKASGNDKNNEDYKRKCSNKDDPTYHTTPVLPTKSSTATTAATTAATATTTATTNSSRGTPDVVSLKGNRTLYFVVYLVPLVTFLLVFGPLMLYCWKRQRNPLRLFCWRLTKDYEIAAQELEYLEKRSHQSSSPPALRKSQNQKFPEENSVILSCHETPPPNHPDITHIDRWPAVVLYAVIKEVPLRRWKEFLRLLSVTDQQMERIEMEAGLGSIEKQYQMLRLWSQHSSASMKDVFTSLYYMDLSGCAQRLQESLEQLQSMPANADCNV